MARQLTQTLTKFSLLNSTTTTTTTATSALLPRLSPLSSTNFFSSKAQLIEVDLESSPSSGGGEIEVIAGMQRLEDAIHSIIVRRHEPDWLPFRPGSSFWVPPRRAVADNLVQLVGRLTNPLSEEESLSLTSANGWPSSSFFLDQGAGSSPVVEVHVFSGGRPENVPLSEDEE